MKKNIVTIGGGTGSFTILSGLKKFDDFTISAVVSMADDGGSTGRLRDELGVLPPGDVRQCLVALSEEPKVVRDLFNYRFESGDLKGHTVGNIIISALEKKNGSFSKGLDVAMKVLKIKGKVIPVTDENVDLALKLKNGKLLMGESEINHNFTLQKEGIGKVYLQPQARINNTAKKAIEKADVVMIGPGNHYCSIIPNLLVKGVKQALTKSKAKVVYVVNLVNKKGHTNGFTLSDYVESINNYIGSNRIDYAILNVQKPKPQLIRKYQNKSEDLVETSPDHRNEGFKVVTANLLGRAVEQNKADSIGNTRSLIRHDSNKLAKIIKYISDLDEYTKVIKKIY